MAATTPTRTTPNLLSHEEECCLKSALAFVVLRKRLEAKKKKNAAPKNDDDPLNAEQHDALPFLRGLLSKDRDNETTTMPLPLSSDKEHHLESMMRVAVSTALPLYYDISHHETTASRHHHAALDDSTASSTRTPSNNNSSSSPCVTFPNSTTLWVYDYDRASLAAVFQPQQQPNHNNDILYDTLDGLTTHLSCQLRAMMMQLSLVASSKNQDEQDSTFQQQQDEWIRTWIRNTFLTTATTKSASAAAPQQHHPYNNRRRALSTILATCTVWHRIVYWDCSSTSQVILVIGTILQDLYHDKILFESENNTTTTIESSSSAPRLPCTADVLAVNLLYLLEAILALRLRAVNDASSQDTTAATSNDAALLVMEELRHALGSLLLPVPICDMAHFYHEQQQHRQDGEGLTPGGKLMLRMCLYDIVQKLASHYP